MSSLNEILKSFFEASLENSEFTKDDKAVLRNVLLHVKKKEFGAALREFSVYKRFLLIDFDKASAVIVKLRASAGMSSVPTGAAALAALGDPDEGLNSSVWDSDTLLSDDLLSDDLLSDDPAKFHQHVSRESTFTAPKTKRQLSDNSKKSEQPRPKKPRAAPTCGQCGQQGHTARSQKCPKNCKDASGGGAAKSTTKKPRKKSAFNMFTKKRGTRAQWKAASPEVRAEYQKLADKFNATAPTVAKPTPVVEESKVETMAQESKMAEESKEASPEKEVSPEPSEPPHSVPSAEPPSAEPPSAEPSEATRHATPRQEPQLPGEDSSDDEEYVKEEDRDRHNTPYLNVRDAIKVTLSVGAAALVAEASAPRGQSKEFKAAKKIAIFLEKTTVRAEEAKSQDDESKEDVYYSPEEANQFYVASEVDVNDEGVLEEIELGLHKDGTEDEYKFKHKMTIPVRFVQWEIISRADQTVEVTEGAEDDRWRAVLDCLHTYGGKGHPFGVPLFDANGSPLLDDRGQQRYNDIDNIAAIEGEEGIKGVSTLLKEAAAAARKVYTDALKPRGHTWKAQRETDGFIGDVDLHEFVPPGELEPLRQAWLNKVSLSNGPTNDSDVDSYVFDPAWKPPIGARTEEGKDSDADQIHIRTWAIRVGMQQMPAIEYKMKGNQPKIEYDDDDEDKEYPVRAVASAGRRILIQWGAYEYAAIVVANDPNVDPPLLRCEYTRPSVQVGQWTMSKVRHGKDFRYVVEGPESAGEAKEGNFELGEPETFERVQKFFAAHGIVNVPIISTDEGADWGPFDLNFEEDTFKKMELYDGKDPEAPKRKEDAAILAEDAAVSAAVKRLAVQEAHKGDVLEEDDPYLNNVVLFKGGEHDVEERKFEGGTYLYEIAGQWVPQDELEIKPDEEIVFEEDANRHGGGGGESPREEEQEDDSDIIYIYTDDEGEQHRVKIVGEPYQKTMPNGKVDLSWYWDKRNEAERVRLRVGAIQAGRAKNEEISIGKYEIRRARRGNSGYTIFEGDSDIQTVDNLEALLAWLAKKGLVINQEDIEDINAIRSLWDVSEEYIAAYVEKYKDETGNDKQKRNFVNSYSEFVNVVDDTGHRFTEVEQAKLIRASEVDTEAAAAATAQAAEEARVAQEDAKNAGVAVSTSDDSSSDVSSSDDEDE